METMTERWTDGRMDDLNAKVDDLGRRVDHGFRDLRVEMNAKLERVEGRIDEVNRTMLLLGGGALVTFVVGFAGLIATQL